MYLRDPQNSLPLTGRVCLRERRGRYQGPSRYSRLAHGDGHGSWPSCERKRSRVPAVPYAKAGFSRSAQGESKVENLKARISPRMGNQGSTRMRKSELAEPTLAEKVPTGWAPGSRTSWFIRDVTLLKLDGKVFCTAFLPHLYQTTAILR